MTQNPESTDKIAAFKKLFSALQNKNQQHALGVIHSLLFVQAKKQNTAHKQKNPNNSHV